MKQYKKLALIGGSCLLGLSILCVVWLALTGHFQSSFKKITDEEIFADVPLMEGEQITFSDVYDAGGGNYLIWAYDTSMDEYKAYLNLLKKNKFAKYTDNGEDGLEGFVYTEHYQKGNLLVVVTYYAKTQETMINVCQDATLSEHLIYRDEYVADNIPGAKTKLTEPELYSTGNSFVFQLKNGHYILNDGGIPRELFPLLDYLEANAPNGEKPVVDAWIISHAHEDHMGVLEALMKIPELADRISVEGLYYTEASEAANEERRGTINMIGLTIYTKGAASFMKTSEGETTPLYRMREGERYYFNDITMDVVFEQSILNYKEWTTSNAESTVLTYTVEGQKVFISGDTDYECQMKMLQIFDDSYFDFAIYEVPHHGGNNFEQFTRHIQTKTVVVGGAELATTAFGRLNRYAQQLYLRSKSEEYLTYGQGGLVFTFPYQVGEYERLPLIDWDQYERYVLLYDAN